MIGRVILGTAFAVILVSPGFAGPCTQRRAPDLPWMRLRRQVLRRRVQPRAKDKV